MFENNDRISPRQLGRQLGLSFLGVWLFLLSGFCAGQGREGIFGIGLGGLLLAVYLFFLLRLSGAYRQLPGALPLFGKIVFCILLLCWTVSAGALLLRVTADMTAGYLLPGIDAKYLAGMLILTALLGSGKNIQIRARMAEVSFPLVASAFVAMLLLAGFQMKQPPVAEAASLSGEKILQTAAAVLTVGSGIGLAAFLFEQVEGELSVGKTLWRWLRILLLFLGGAALVLLGTFGREGISHRKIPILSLMAQGSIPGGFLERFDIVWISVLLYSLLFSLGSLLFYSGHLSERCGAKPWAIRVIAAVGMWLGMAGFFGKLPVFLLKLSVPLFWLLLFLAVLVKRRKS